MKIGIDIDDTIAHSFEVMFTYSQEFNGEILKKTFKPKKVKTRFKKFYFQELYNWTQEEKKKFINMYYEKSLDEVKPKTLAVETINKLKEMGNEIYIITSRYSINSIDIFEVTTNWLKKHHIKFDKLIISKDDKSESIKNNKIDIYIDDDYKVCRKSKKECIVFMMNMEVNKKNHIKGVKRVYAWPHVLGEIKKISKNKDLM